MLPFSGHYHTNSQRKSCVTLSVNSVFYLEHVLCICYAIWYSSKCYMLYFSLLSYRFEFQWVYYECITWLYAQMNYSFITSAITVTDPATTTSHNKHRVPSFLFPLQNCPLSWGAITRKYAQSHHYAETVPMLPSKRIPLLQCWQIVNTSLRN